MDAKLETLHKIVHIVEMDTFVLAHSNNKAMHCKVRDTLIKLVCLNVTCIWHFNLWLCLQDLWHQAIFLLVLIFAIKFLQTAGSERRKS
jgi:hypothetical protein